jgi:hypothetical protein
MRDTFIMGKFVKGAELLNIGVETSVGLGSILFTGENTFSVDASIGINAWFEKMVLISHT